MDDEDARFLRVHVSRLRRKVHVLREDVDELKEAIGQLKGSTAEPEPDAGTDR